MELKEFIKAEFERAGVLVYPDSSEPTLKLSDLRELKEHEADLELTAESYRLQISTFRGFAERAGRTYKGVSIYMVAQPFPDIQAGPSKEINTFTYKEIEFIMSEDEAKWLRDCFMVRLYLDYK